MGRWLPIKMTLLLAGCTALAQPRTVIVDASSVTGSIRSLQGVNLGPLHTQTNLPDLTAQYRDLRIDRIRTHDFFGPMDIDSRPKDRGADLVIFPHWNADPEKEASYHFGPSDRMIKGIVDCGAKVYFRLGRSFSADPTPPPDFDKFAEVCRHIAMHYNAGWANGHHYGIQYWEVWNEPNVQRDWIPNKGLYLFWSGTREQFFDLYARTARALKAFDPKLKVGGPGLAEGARESSWREGFVEYCAANHVPLDFLSWHHYAGDSSDPWDLVRIGRDVRRILDNAGLHATENHVNEWSVNLNKNKTGPQNQLSMEAAAFNCSALIYLQDAPVDLSLYYRGDAGPMGCFEPDGSPRKKAFALKATGAMLDTPQRLQITGGDTTGFAVLSGRSADKDTVQILISNYQIEIPKAPPRQSAPPGSHGLERRQLSGERVPGYVLRVENLPWGKRPFTIQRFRTGEHENFALVEDSESSGGSLEITRDLPPPEIELIVLKRK